MGTGAYFLCPSSSVDERSPINSLATSLPLACPRITNALANCLSPVARQNVSVARTRNIEQGCLQYTQVSVRRASVFSWKDAEQPGPTLRPSSGSTCAKNSLSSDESGVANENNRSVGSCASCA